MSVMDDICAKLSEKYPHQIVVPRYVMRMYAGELPRPDDDCFRNKFSASWPSKTKKDAFCRTVGFTSKKRLDAFKREFKL